MKNLNETEKPTTLAPSPHFPPYGWHPPYFEEEEVSLIDYFRVVKKHWLLILLVTFVFTGLGVYLTSKMSKKYQATALIIPLTQSGGGGLAALASQVSSLPVIGGQLSGLAGMAGGTQKTGQIIGILKSRTVIEKVVQDLGLMKVIFKKQWDSEKNAWKVEKPEDEPNLQDAVGVFVVKMLNVQEDKKTNLIKVQVEMTDPILAANVTNRLLNELQDFIRNNQLTVAKRNRIFIEEQLQKNKAEFLEAGKKLNQFYSNNQISSVQPQLDVNIGKIEAPQKIFEEFQNEFSKLQQKKDELASQFPGQEKNTVIRGVPSQVYLQYLTLQRELLGRVNVLLTQQYEMSKIEEAKEDLSFQIIDKAVAPLRPSKPKKMMNIAIAFTAGFFFSLFLAFFIEFLGKVKEAERAKRGA